MSPMHNVPMKEMVWNYSTNYPNYQIHNDGIKVRNRTTKRVLKPRYTESGVPQYKLNGKNVNPKNIITDSEYTQWAMEYSPMMLCDLDADEGKMNIKQ